MPIASLQGKLSSPITWSYLKILGSHLICLETSGARAKCSSSFPSLQVRMERACSTHHPAHSVSSPCWLGPLPWSNFLLVLQVLNTVQNSHVGFLQNRSHQVFHLGFGPCMGGQRLCPSICNFISKQYLGPS